VPSTGRQIGQARALRCFLASSARTRDDSKPP